MTDHPPSDGLPPGTELRDGAYRLEEALGRGAFGVTYRATHVPLNRQVAIKEFFPQGLASRGLSGQVLAPSWSEDEFGNDLDRFLREARTLAALNHPNIVRVTDYFEGNGTGYLVMEYVHGQDLRHALAAASGRGLLEARVREIISDLVDALEVVHAAGILHLDIKPDNVLLTRDDRVLLIDFGAAKRTIPTQSTRIFTVMYAPPEMFTESIPLGPQTDIFALGMMAHELLTGKLPPDSLNRAMHTSWRPRELPGNWKRLLTEALELDPELRPHDVRAWWSGTNRSPGVEFGTPSFAVAPKSDSLADMVMAADPGATIQLAARSYHLDSGLVLDKPITLVGAGMDRTFIDSADGECVLAYDGVGQIALRDLSARWSGPSDADAHVVHLRADDVAIERCCFSDAPWSDTWVGVGLGIVGGATATVKHCQFLNNGTGLHVGDEVTFVVAGTTCVESRVAGMVFFGTCKGVASNNGCHQGQTHGIYIAEGARATLRGNRLLNNGGNGIMCAGNGIETCWLQDNVCEQNGLQGIWVGERARPAVTGNTCDRNKQGGIAFVDASGGSAEGNTCRGNQVGIYVASTAHPQIGANTVGRRATSPVGSKRKRGFWGGR